MPASEARRALEVTDLVVRHGSTTAVDGVSFDLRPGQILGLLGPNGAGKTSTVEVCEGYRRPDEGTVRVLGADPVTHHYRLMPHVGVMLQSGGCYPGARAGELLRLLASFAADPLDVGSLAGRLGLDRVAGTPYRRLSGGERQRLSLAMAIVGRPHLLFLDEPTAGMDAEARHTTWELIDELRRSGVAILLTTHLLDEAERLADRVVIIDRGRVVAAGTPAALTATAGSHRLHVCTAAPVPLDDLRERLPAGATAGQRRPGEYLVDGLTAESLTPLVGLVARWASEHRTTITDLHTGRRSLEDVFLDLTGTRSSAEGAQRLNTRSSAEGARRSNTGSSTEGARR